MSTENTYNGWTSYATWRVNLEICDDLCNSWHADRETFEDVSDIAERLKDETEEIVTNYGTLDGLAVDYAMSFLSDVNWYEIAEHWTDELIEQEEDEEHEIFVSSQREADELGLQVVVPEFGCNVIVSRA